MCSMSEPRADLFETVDPADFARMIDVDRYATRSETFDRLIAEAHLHFWDPSDPAYIDFGTPFDMQRQTVIPMSMVPELHSAVAERLSESQRIAFTNDCALWLLSSVLHGEQGALSLSSSLCHLLRNPGAVEYAANQAREEARHVNAFSRYIAARWGKPAPASPSLTDLLGELVSTQEVYKKIVGMQLLVEGLAMGILSTLHRCSGDPLLKRLTQLVMTDEAFHHKAGKMWSAYAVPDMSEDQRDAVEDWALGCFQIVVSNLLHAREKQALYDKYGLQAEWVIGAMREAYASKERRRDFMEVNRIFHVMVRTLLNAGLITKRTRHHYAVWVDLKELAAQDDEVVEDAAVAEGIGFLKQVNEARATRQPAR